MVTGALLAAMTVAAQFELPPLQPEQDACNALYLCGNSFSTPYSYQGPGSKVDFTSTPCGGEETNSMYMMVKIGGPGKLCFDIIPKEPGDDYDFAVFNITNGSCDRLAASQIVRCNFNNNFDGSNVDGIVGIRKGYNETSVQGGTFQHSFLKPIDAHTGDTYLIMINNFGNYANGGPSQGFTIDFSQSDAFFDGSRVPTLEKINKKCTDTELTFSLTLPVKCSSVAADGSDFRITPAVGIAKIEPLNCNALNGYTRQVTITFSNPPAPGNYMLHVQKGSDGNSVVDLCDHEAEEATLPFTIPRQITPGFLMADTVKCSYEQVWVGPTAIFESYKWSTGETTPTILVDLPGKYQLNVIDSNACTAVAEINVKDSTCPEHIFVPNAFSPNGDGLNDKLKAIFQGDARNFQFSVFDRWGKKVYETTDIHKYWDGTVNGTPMQQGTYVWYCRYVLFRKHEMKRGTVLLIR
ncbi:hypothetical protein FPE01S_01_01760 [Flavihumibacter petaseus NBRC 106054]|uniref:Gliding motility-associated C-terminal domain-containing protein n=2 Tax=Flavihumibacter TaxID=1004301 RepID=A0A0E9MUB8_9BACT|nr:hypothetical protein FPE01S_01_01760 [Flavihumibacter petaseus NBRC 106054]